MLAAQFVVTLTGVGGIRIVCKFLELAGLDSFVAAGFGSQQRAIAEMEQAVVDFGEEEKRRLGEQMPHRSITICQDETFHPDSDEGLGLLRHVRESLGAHHSPDIFHVQQEATRGTAGALGAKGRQADKSREEAERRVVRLLDDLEICGASRGGPGASEDHERLADEAIAEYEQAVAADEAARQRQQQARDAVRGISGSYHPFDLETGKARQADQVSPDLDGKFRILDEVAWEASLSERCRQRIANFLNRGRDPHECWLAGTMIEAEFTLCNEQQNRGRNVPLRQALAG